MDDPASDRPEQIGPYKLLELLGEGGMGEVWLAEQSEPVRRRVALKIIKLGMDTKQVLARLEAERQALAVMDHPSIASFYDGGAAESGRPYFVMELVRGPSITDYCDTNRLTTAERIQLFVDVCQAVQHAHHKGVIHRDLKPSNVLVTVRDQKPLVKIIDFGIAKALGQGLTDKTLVTRMEQIIGTPEYMSPEQAEMSGLDVDTRTDVYSLGVMLYELLVGARPLDLRARADQAIRYAIRETQVPRPSTRLATLGETQEIIAQHRRTTVEALRRELKSDLDWVILKAMEKDRTRRYDTASGLALELERHLRHEPVLAHAPTARYRAGKFVKRHRMGVAFTGVLILLLSAWAGSTSVQAGRIARERDRATQEAAKAQAVRDFMTRILAAPNPTGALGPDASILEAVNSAVEETTGRFSDEPEVDAAIRHEIGRVYLRLGEYDAARPLLEGALQARMIVHTEGEADTGETLGLLADLEATFGNRDSADVLYSRSLDLLQDFGGPGDTRAVDVKVRHAALLTAMGRYDRAEAMLLEALEGSGQDGSDPAVVAAAASRLAILYWTIGDLDRAERYARETLEIREAILPGDHVLLAESLHNLAMVLDDRGRKEESAEHYGRALATYERVFGGESEYVAITLNNLALVHADLGNNAEAEAMYRRALGIDLGLFGEDHIGPAVDRLNLGRFLCETGGVTEGTGMVTAAVRVFETMFEVDQYEMLVARSSSGVCLGAARRFPEAERALLEALAGIEAAMGADHPQLAIIRGRLVDLYDAWGRPEQAAEYRH